jgi:hypothetical protein
MLKMTFTGRQPQNIKTGISQQPLIGSSLNFKFKALGPDQNGKFIEMKMTSNGRRPQNIKICIF